MELPFLQEDADVAVGPDLRRRSRRRPTTHHGVGNAIASSGSDSESSDNSGYNFSKKSINGESCRDGGDGSVGIEEENEGKFGEILKLGNLEDPTKLEAPNGTENEAGAQFTNGSSVENGHGTVAHPPPLEENAPDEELAHLEKSPTFGKHPDTEIDIIHEEKLLDKSSESFSFPPLVSSNVQPSTEKEEEFDVEKVLEKQETHDLYCPNCNSCITKRVILRRRKRKIQEISSGGDDFRLVPIEMAPPAPSVEPGDVVEEPVAERDTETKTDDTQDAFRCLSCFSIFIPDENGFLFWRFGRKPDNTVKQGVSSNIPSRDIAPPAQVPLLTEEVDTNVGPTHTDGKRGGGTEIEHVVTTEDVSPLPPEEPSVPEKEKIDRAQTTAVSNKKESGNVFNFWILNLLQVSKDKPDDSILGPPATNICDPEREPLLKPPEEIPVSKPKPPVMPPEEVSISVPGPEPPIIPPDGGDVVIPMPGQPSKPLSTVTPPESVTVPDVETGTTAPVATPAPVRGSGPELDIVKAIVYGGLLELITSLSIVTSAAGGDASTLNLVALGVANVLGGLFLLAHNLRVLHHEATEERYYEQMGHRGHFCLHATAAVISYLVCGLMPPLVYGFSFRKSDNRDLKLIVIASISLFFIALLAIGKAHVRRGSPKRYITTLMYYLSLGITGSGIAYVVGDLINMLLLKLGLFESSSSLNLASAMLVPGASTVKTAWASY